MKLIELNRPGKGDYKIISILDDLREMAQNHEITDLAIVAVDQDGQVVTVYDVDKLFTVLGGLKWLSQRIVDQVESVPE